jgi:hypothetical protein
MPAGDPVDLQHEVAPVLPPQQVYAPIVGADRRHGPQRELLARLVEPHRLGPRPPREVRPPARTDPGNRRDHTVADHQRADVAARVRDRLLQVIHGAFELEGAEHARRDVGVRDACHP